MSTPQRHTERIAALRRILQRHITVRTMIGWALPACYALFILGLFLLSSELHDPKVWFKDSASIRDLLVSIAAVGGVPFLIWREWNTHRTASAATHQAEAAAHQAEIAEERHQRQTEADQQRRIIDLFGKAIELLGKEELETRLGAIYALERIAHESERDYWPIMETLCSPPRCPGSLAPGFAFPSRTRRLTLCRESAQHRGNSSSRSLPRYGGELGG